MTTFWLKQCPKCSGDLYIDKDMYGTSITCLQCGRRREVTGGIVFQPEMSIKLVPVLPKSERDPGGISGNISPQRRRRVSRRSDK